MRISSFQIPARACALVCVINLGVSLPAQVATDPADRTAVAAAAKTMTDAMVLRRDAAVAVAQDQEKPEAALTRLRQEPSPSGLKLAAEADFALAALDVGQRLIAAGRPEKAEVFFREAEKSLTKALKATPDAMVNDKVQFLSALALLHARYLNQAAQAKADLDAARKLKPDDRQQEGLRDTLGKEHGEVFKERPAKDGQPGQG